MTPRGLLAPGLLAPKWTLAQATLSNFLIHIPATLPGMELKTLFQGRENGSRPLFTLPAERREKRKACKTWSHKSREVLFKWSTLWTSSNSPCPNGHKSEGQAYQTDLSARQVFTCFHPRAVSPANRAASPKRFVSRRTCSRIELLKEPHVLSPLHLLWLSVRFLEGLIERPLRQLLESQPPSSQLHSCNSASS